MREGAKYSRYAHAEGFTALCFTHDGKYIITCGADCDVRLWPSNGVEEDESPPSVILRESATSIVERNGVVYVGTGNFVESYVYPGLEYSEKPLRFTAAVTDIDVSSDGKFLVAGSCDMKMQVKNLETGEITELSGHTAPILRVALSKDVKFVASSSCDGSVKVWDSSKGVTLKTFYKTVPTVNDFISARCLGSPAWFDQSHLVIIKDRTLCFHNVSDWSLAYDMSSSLIKRSISLISISFSKTLLCAGTIIGEIIVWNIKDQSVLKYLEDSNHVSVSGLTWSPSKIEFAFSDRLGRVFIMSPEKDKVDDEDQVDQPDEMKDIVADKKEDDNVNDNDDDDDENVISISAIKASVMLPEEENLDNENENVEEENYPVKNTIETDLQRTFQPSSTPSHFEHGYMVWNSVGIVRSFNSEEDSSIDVEFHDTMLHHSIHKRNNQDYVMATLTCKVLCLASTSMLTCIYLNAWDEKKEWSLDMPDGESITAVTSSGNWVCCATDLNQLRFYGTTGMQRQVVSLSGPVVCINGHETLLIVITHLGLGLPGCQNLGYTIFEITDFFIKALTPCQPLPMSPETKLKWAGFTDEGTPCTYDSAGILRLSRDFLHWQVACNTRLHCKNQSDNYFVLGVSERLQCVRCVLCKGSWYPMTLPRPTVVEIPLKIPLCCPDESKSNLEDIFWRHVFSLPVLEEPSRENDDYRVALNEWEKILKQTIMKLFAEAHRNRADMRAVALASLMSEQPLGMALKLVQGEGRMYLADKLHNIEPKDWNELRHGPTNDTNIANYVGLVSYNFESNGMNEIRNKYTHKSQGDMFELSQPSPSTGSRLVASTKEKSSSQDEKNNSSAPTPAPGPGSAPAPTPTPAARVNPFKVQNKEANGLKGLNFFNKFDQSNLKPTKPETTNIEKASKVKQSNTKETKTKSGNKMKFFDWFKIHKPSLVEQYPNMGTSELTKAAMKLFREEVRGGSQKQSNESSDVDEDKEQLPESKRRKTDDLKSKVKASAADKLNHFNFTN